MKALLYIIIIGASLLVGALMNNTFFRAHYLGIGKKLTYNLTLKGMDCGYNECEISLADNLDPHSVYVIQWQGKMVQLESKIKATFILNEHGKLCLINFTDGYFKEDFSHLSFCYPVIKQSEEEWSKSKLKLSPN